MHVVTYFPELSRVSTETYYPKVTKSNQSTQSRKYVGARWGRSTTLHFTASRRKRHNVNVATCWLQRGMTGKAGK